MVFFLGWKEAVVMWQYRFVLLQVHLLGFFPLLVKPQSFWIYCVNMWHWDVIWLSVFNYISSSTELTPLVPAPPSSKHLLKQTSSKDVAKHCTFLRRPLWEGSLWSSGIVQLAGSFWRARFISANTLILASLCLRDGEAGCEKTRLAFAEWLCCCEHLWL